MIDYSSVRDNIVIRSGGKDLYRRVFVVSADGGMTNPLLPHKKSAQPAVYSLFVSGMEGHVWSEKLEEHDHDHDYDYGRVICLDS